RIEHFCIADPHHLNVAKFAKRPRGVVVDLLLRIVRTPVLIVQKHVRDSAVRLIHSHNVAARRKLASLSIGLLLIVGRLLLRRSGRVVPIATRRSFLLLYGDRERRGCARYLTPLKLKGAEQFGLRAWPGIVGRKDVRRGPFGLWLQDRSLALQVEV